MFRRRGLAYRVRQRLADTAPAEKGAVSKASSRRHCAFLFSENKQKKMTKTSDLCFSTDCKISSWAGTKQSVEHKEPGLLPASYLAVAMTGTAFAMTDHMQCTKPCRAQYICIMTRLSLSFPEKDPFCFPMPPFGGEAPGDDGPPEVYGPCNTDCMPVPPGRQRRKRALPPSGRRDKPLVSEERIADSVAPCFPRGFSKPFSCSRSGSSRLHLPFSGMMTSGTTVSGNVPLS
jgi:hypothetical protein